MFNQGLSQLHRVVRACALPFLWQALQKYERTRMPWQEPEGFLYPCRAGVWPCSTALLMASRGQRDMFAVGWLFLRDCPLIQVRFLGDL